MEINSVEKGIIKIEKKIAWTICTCELDTGTGLVKNWEIVQNFKKSHAGWRKLMADFAIMLNGKQKENDFHHDPFEVILEKPFVSCTFFATWGY